MNHFRAWVWGGIQEGFEVVKVSAWYPVRLGMQIASGRVRRKTEPTGPGDRDGI